MGKKNDLNSAFERLSDAEQKFLKETFLAPVLSGQGVQVRIAGVICQLKVEPREVQGWGIFQPLSHTKAKKIRDANMAERRAYLDLLPACRVVYMGLAEGRGLGLPAHPEDSRFQIEGLLPLELPEQVDLFEIVVGRFDGGRFWYGDLDRRADPGHGAYLRESLLKMRSPADLTRKGLSGPLREAYAKQFAAMVAQREAERKKNATFRIQDALEHAGAHLVDFSERQDVVRVNFMVDGQRHASVIHKKDLTVRSAGICLSGEDRKFDLASLVGVLREGASRDELSWEDVE